jgi:hypothetical protein
LSRLQIHSWIIISSGEGFTVPYGAFSLAVVMLAF